MATTKSTTEKITKHFSVTEKNKKKSQDLLDKYYLAHKIGDLQMSCNYLEQAVHHLRKKSIRIADLFADQPISPLASAVIYKDKESIKFLRGIYLISVSSEPRIEMSEADVSTIFSTHNLELGGEIYPQLCRAKERILKKLRLNPTLTRDIPFGPDLPTQLSEIERLEQRLFSDTNIEYIAVVTTKRPSLENARLALYYGNDDLYRFFMNEQDRTNDSQQPPPYRKT